MAEVQIIANTMPLEKVQKTDRSGTSGHDAPFATLTTAHWEEMREQAEQCLDRFVSAAEQRQANKVLMIGLEMLEVAERMLLEAYTMRADLPLRELAEVYPGTRIAR